MTLPQVRDRLPVDGNATLVPLFQGVWKLNPVGDAFAGEGVFHDEYFEVR